MRPSAEWPGGVVDSLPEGGGMLLATSGPYTPRTFSVPPTGTQYAHPGSKKRSRI